MILGAMLSGAICGGGQQGSTKYCLEQGYWDPVLESGLGRGLVGEHLVVGPLPTGPSWAQPKRAIWILLPVGPPSAGGATGVRCIVNRAVAKG